MLKYIFYNIRPYDVINEIELRGDGIWMLFFLPLFIYVCNCIYFKQNIPPYSGYWTVEDRSWNTYVNEQW